MTHYEVWAQKDEAYPGFDGWEQCTYRGMVHKDYIEWGKPWKYEGPEEFLTLKEAREAAQAPENRFRRVKIIQVDLLQDDQVVAVIEAETPRWTVEQVRWPSTRWFAYRNDDLRNGKYFESWAEARDYALTKAREEARRDH